MADMTLAEKIHDAFLDRDLTPGDINDIIAERLYSLLCSADGALSAIRHGRKLEDRDLESIYYPIRDFCDELAVASNLATGKEAKNTVSIKMLPWTCGNCGKDAVQNLRLYDGGPALIATCDHCKSEWIS